MIISTFNHRPTADKSVFSLESLDPRSESADVIKQITDMRRLGTGFSMPLNDEPKEPILLAEQAYDALANAKTLTSRVAMHLDANLRQKIFQQLDALHDLSEWEPGDVPVKIGSFQTFLKTILDLKPQRRPSLGMSGAGNLIAAWTTGRNTLTLVFLPNDRVRWVLSLVKDDDNVERAAGDVSVADLARRLQSFNPEIWFNNGAEKSS